ncbi:MAG: hypothetical protein Q7U75_06445, partial [Desulfobacterales bacterium]|nr:hypothetical protein [Desulfobacterales bacterium]
EGAILFKEEIHGKKKGCGRRGADYNGDGFVSPDSTVGKLRQPDVFQNSTFFQKDSGLRKTNIIVP